MAIIIPSAKIYNKKNPKVRDNVIERIEVGAVEVVPDNSFGNTVYNKKVIIDNPYKEETLNEETLFDTRYSHGQQDLPSSISSRVISARYVNHKYYSVDLYVPITDDKHYISALILGKDSDGNDNIKISTNGYINKGTAESEWNTKLGSLTQSDIIYTETENNSNNPSNYSIPKSISIKYDLIDKPLVDWVAEEDIIDNGNLGSVKETTTILDGIQYYKLSLKFLCGVRTVLMQGYAGLQGDDVNSGTSITVPMEGEYEEYIPTQVDILLLGNKIGIDFENKTIYINGQTSKKVHSIEGNELMQTSNYLDEEIKIPIKILSPILTSNGTGYTYRLEHNYNFDKSITYVNFQGQEGRITKYGKEFYCLIDSIYNDYVDQTIEVSLTAARINALNKFFEDTQKAYKNGKETATILCSISDYYDYDTNEKVISIDNSTKKMSFNEYDQVIPMVYGADGKDYPMSLNKDGSPKVFSVLGTKIFFDGAVWQELYLQEC